MILREEQAQCRLRELHAWYAPVYVHIEADTSEDAMNMCPLFRRSSSDVLIRSMDRG